MSYYRKGMSERQAAYLLWCNQAFRIISVVARRFARKKGLLVPYL